MLHTDIKRFFFDSKTVISKLAAAERRVLSKIGAAIRSAAMKSLKYKKGASSPGTPPHAHKIEGFKRRFGKSKSGKKRPVSPLRELIYFAYDPARSSVVVGPIIFRGSAVGGGVVPRVQEEGGTAPIIVNGKIKRGTYPARPYMAPALQLALPTARREVKDMIR